jgi:hypothetical protein
VLSASCADGFLLAAFYVSLFACITTLSRFVCEGFSTTRGLDDDLLIHTMDFWPKVDPYA